MSIVLALLFGCSTPTDTAAAEKDTAPLSCWVDADGDGYGGGDPVACDAGTVGVDGDCDDADPAHSPATVETCDGTDENCDGAVDEGLTTTFWVDADGDGYGWPYTRVNQCTAPEGYVQNDDDCDDGDAAISPDAVEVCDFVDNDCASGVDNGVNYAAYTDADGDGYGDAATGEWVCEFAADQVTDATDCDDGDAGVNPGAAEVCDGVDDDCDSSVDEDLATVTAYTDADADGYGDPATAVSVCALADGQVEDGTDCDDTNATVNPAAVEVCDEVDDDCDSEVDEGC